MCDDRTTAYSGAERIGDADFEINFRRAALSVQVPAHTAVKIPEG